MIPDFQQVLLPFLKVMADKKERCMIEVIDILAQTFKVSKDEIQKRHPHGQKIFSCLVRRARTKFHEEGLIEKSKRFSFWRITQSGQDVLLQNPDSINLYQLKQESINQN